MRWNLFKSRNSKTARRQSRRSCPLHVESLEERRLLSTNPISEFVVPDTGSRPAFITTGQPGDNELWFTDPQFNRVGRINLNGVFDTFISLPTPFSNPQSITAGPDGNMWVIEAEANQVARISPFGTVTEFRIPSAGGGSFGNIIAGPDGNLWLAEFGASKIDRLTPSGSFTEFQVPGYFRTNMPQNLTVGPDGHIWFTLPWANQVGYITTSGSFHMFTTGISNQAFPFGITAGSDGNLWFTEPAKDQVARITPSGVVTEFYVGITQGSSPSYITAGSDGALWFTEPVAAGNHVINPHIGRITIYGVVTEYAVPEFGQCSGGITLGRDGNSWYTDDNGKIDVFNVFTILPSNLGNAALIFTHSYENYANFITGCYQHYLGRSPGANEIPPWVSLMRHGLSDEQVEADFISAPEYIQDHGGLGAGWVESMYQDLLGRTPAPQEVNGWLVAMQNGWTPAQVAYGFAASPEREAIRVQQDYQQYLGRTASAAEVNGWVNAFLNLHYSNEDVTAGFIASWEYYNNPNRGKGDNTDWLLSVYRDVLHRLPGSGELAGWLAYLAQG
jgi:streptogramin lyase